MTDRIGAPPRPAAETRAEIEASFGFVPPFFEPAFDSPAVLESLWTQTRAAYVDNPLPAEFKERLFAALSNGCTVPYCLVCHSCALRPLGLSPAEVLATIEAPSRPLSDREAGLLERTPPLRAFPARDNPLSDALLRGAIACHRHEPGHEAVRGHMRRILAGDYQHLVALLGYIAACFVWVEAHPELSYAADERARRHLGPLLDGEPALATFFGSYRTRLRSAEQRLLDDLATSRRRFGDVFAQSPVAMALVARDFTFTAVNHEFADLIGCRADELVGSSFADITHPDDLELDAMLAGRVFAGRLPGYQIDKRYVTRDGRTIWINLTAGALRDHEGNVTDGIAIVRDVSDRKAAESEFDRTQAVTQVGMWRWEPGTGHAPTWTSEVERIFGADPGRRDGRALDAFIALVHPDDRGAVTRAIESAASGSDEFALDFRVQPPDGEPRWMHVRGGRVGDPSGALVLAGTVQDVTDRVQAQRALRSALERERTTTQRLRRLEQFRSAIMRSLSHDIRSPLAVVLGLAETLRAGVAPERTSDLLERISANALRADRLLSDLLDVERDGDIEVRRVRTDVGALVARVAAEHLPGRDAVMHLGDAVAEVDPVLTERIVANLVANVVRHAPGARIEVTVARTPQGVLIGVDDDGPGVADERKLEIFEPFRSEGRHAGSGVGLSLVATFAHLHGGRAWVEDRPGGGASFRVLLRDDTAAPD